MKRKNDSFFYLCLLFSLVFLASVLSINRSWAAGGTPVSVYAESAYTDSDLAVYVYADIPSPMALISMGIKVNYDSTKLTVGSMEKNEGVWYFGTSSHKYPYVDPEDTGNSVIILGGKLDTSNPTAGVTGNRVLLGKIVFNRSESGDPGSNPEDYFGISVELGKGGTYANFVDTDGNELDDGVTFSAIVRERGDANIDHVITNLDMFKVKDLIIQDTYSVFADCNDDGVITNLDMFCVKDKI